MTLPTVIVNQIGNTQNKDKTKQKKTYKIIWFKKIIYIQQSFDCQNICMVNKIDRVWYGWFELKIFVYVEDVFKWNMGAYDMIISLFHLYSTLCSWYSG